MKKLARHKVTFENDEDQRMLVLAQLGQSNKSIQFETTLSSGQITYRCSRGKKALGFKNGLRVTWREGNHPLFRQVLEDMAGIMIKEIERKVIPKLVHPTPKTIKIKE